MGNRTYIGAEDPETGQRVTLAVTPPAEAENAHFDDTGLEGRFLEREADFADTEPIPPGTATAEALFSYDLPYREGLRVARTFDLPVVSVVLVLPDEGMALEGAGLTSEGAMDTQMGPALSYVAGPLAAGESLAFTLVAGPPPASLASGAVSSSIRNPALETAVGLVALAAAVVSIYLLWRPSSPGPLPARARPLVEAIAALDAGFEAGQVGERTYRRKRKALKQQLRGLLGEDAGTVGQADRGRKRRKVRER
jgi:hypothetical protein